MGRSVGRISEVVICILAGGASRRFRANKAFANLHGKPLLEHVIERIRAQKTGPMDFVATRLRTGAPAIAASLGRPHPVNALWPANDLGALHNYLASGKRSVFGWAESCQARVAEFQASLDAIDSFLNVNTPDDLRSAEQASVAHRTEIAPP